MATCDSVAQPMLVVLCVTCFVLVLFSLFTSVLQRLELHLQCTKMKSFCQRCVLEGGEARTRSLAAVWNLTLGKVTMTVVKQRSC